MKLHFAGERCSSVQRCHYIADRQAQRDRARQARVEHAWRRRAGTWRNIGHRWLGGVVEAEAVTSDDNWVEAQGDEEAAPRLCAVLRVRLPFRGE